MSPESIPPIRSFNAMGVDVVVGGASETEFVSVRALFEEWDRIFSRFRPEGELSRLNRSEADAVVVSPIFAYGLQAALRASASTDGLVDPTLGAAIEAAGYDQDFPLLADDPRPPGKTETGTWRTLRLRGRVICRERGTRLDLNGVVKSLAVDEALGLISGNALVSAGGDAATRGGVEVGLPAGGSIRLVSGGIATSGSTYRRWRRGGQDQHHLIDPRTGRPARSSWDLVTVAAGTCLAADVAAKAAFLLSDTGPGWLEARGLPGRFVRPGSVVTTRAWARALDEVAQGSAEAA